MLSMQTSLKDQIEAGAALARKGDVDGAVEALVELAEAAPDHWEAIDSHLAGRTTAATPHEIELNRRLGDSLAAIDKIDEALACWRRVEELSPEDAQAAGAVSRLTIAKSRRRDGYESPAPASSAPVKERKKPLFKPEPDNWFGARREVNQSIVFHTPAEIALTPLQRLERAVRDCPSHPDCYLELVPLYLEKGRDYDAERVLAKGREATGDDPKVRRLWEDVIMLRLEKKLELARKLVEVEDNEKNQADLVAQIESRDRLESEIFHNRCKREPENAALKLELGRRLKRAGNLREAFKRFEEALADAQQRCAAAFELGECQRQFQYLPQALRYYRLAVDSALEPADNQHRKLALHQAAKLAARIKLPRVAQRYRNELLRFDPQFKEA